MKNKSSFKQPYIKSESLESLSAKLLETTKQLSVANEKLQKAQKERSDMLANISHDLRAPLTAIRSSLDYLINNEDIPKEDLQNSLFLINRRTKTLEDLVQDMYYLFCVEDNSKGLDLETVNAYEFFEQYFYDAIVDTRYDKHKMHLELPKSKSPQISIDIQKMIRVMDNLFTNADKYSEAGSDITLKVENSSDNKSVIIMVKDTGIGISPEHLEHIFDRTYTVSNSRTPNSASGSGLGLTIVKTIIERHNGTIKCESIEKKGSSFIIELPCVTN